MEDQTTYPSLLAAETIPVPLGMRGPAEGGEPSQVASSGLLLVLKILGLALAFWAIKHWW